MQINKVTASKPAYKLRNKRPPHNANYDRKPKYLCTRCGKDHWHSECPHKEHMCKVCRKKGHLEKYCFSKQHNDRRQKSWNNNTNWGKDKQREIRAIEFESETSGDEYDIGHINTDGISEENTKHARIYRNVKINGLEINFRQDSGSDVTIIDPETWRKLRKPPLKPSAHILKAANRGRMDCLGVFHTNFELCGESHQGDCYVVNYKTLLLGNQWMKKVRKLWEKLSEEPEEIKAIDINNITSNEKSRLISKLQQAFSSVFSPGLGKCTQNTAHLKLKPDAQPIFIKARPVSYNVLPKLEEELNRLVDNTVLSRVNHSSYAAPIVQKKSGDIRLCADFSTGLNKMLEEYHYPLPTAEYIFTKFNGSMFFSKIDLSEAYLQIEVNEKAKPLLTINTPKGLFRYNRLPFGVKVAPAIFQETMDKVIADMPGTAAYLDDIIVSGKTIAEHNERVLSLFNRLQNAGLKVKLEKCAFLETSMKYLGFIICAEGRKPDPDKVTAIVKLPPPTNVAELRSLLGMITFYSAFVSNLREIRGPLDKLLQKDTKIEWTDECQKCFESVKEVLQSDLLLTHYDPSGRSGR